MNNTVRMAIEMDKILKEDDAQYLEDIRLSELTKRYIICARCGEEVEDATSNTLRCRPCAVKHSKEQAKAKKLREALTFVNE